MPFYFGESKKLDFYKKAINFQKSRKAINFQKLRKAEEAKRKRQEAGLE
tara:strand:+ start:1746 stop:1892 length:147 start_codon:yes stop_codon:yes gene_type:complete